MNAKVVKPLPPSVPNPDPPTAPALSNVKKPSQRAQSAAALWKSEPELQQAFAGLSKNIVAERERQGMKLTHLAKAAGLPLSTIFAAESGVHNLSLVTLLKIAKALDVDAGSLMPTKDAVQASTGAVAISKIVEGCLETVLLDHRAAATRIEQTLNYISSLQRKPKPQP